MTVAKLQQVAPLVSSGASLPRALKLAEQTRKVVIEVLIDSAEADALEAKHGRSIRQILTDLLVSKGGTKTVRACRLHDTRQAAVAS